MVSVWRPLVLARRPFTKERLRPRRSTLAVIDNSSFYQAIILHVSAIKSLFKHPVEFLLGIL
jgi:hypothetical protein